MSLKKHQKSIIAAVIVVTMSVLAAIAYTGWYDQQIEGDDAYQTRNKAQELELKRLQEQRQE